MTWKIIFKVESTFNLKKKKHKIEKVKLYLTSSIQKRKISQEETQYARKLDFSIKSEI